MSTAIFSSQVKPQVLDELPLVSWKGKTFSQITASVRRNALALKVANSSTVPVAKTLFMKAQPLQMYRKEIASVRPNTCNERTSSTVSNFEIPGANIVNSKQSTTNGLVNTLDMNSSYGMTPYPNTVCETNFPGAPSSFQAFGTNTPYSTQKCLSAENNALKRVRSSGMIRKAFQLNKNNDTYYPGSNQYLYSRNKTFSQNQYHLIRSGDAKSTPGTATTIANTYASNSPSHCSNQNDPKTNYVPIYYKPNNPGFATQGAVESSARLVRLKYDTITDGGAKLATVFGKQTADALSYPSTGEEYTLKHKVGFPGKKTPVFPKYPSSNSAKNTCVTCVTNNTSINMK
jgi:hypothetical protein